MTHRIRRQLTLFVEAKYAEKIEQLRQAFNPKQFELIKCHVTLCRENEIENSGQIISNLNHLVHTAISIEFGQVTRFDNGKGVLLPGKNDNFEFSSLQKNILHGMNDYPAKQEPHITIMHPGNSTCSDIIFRQIEKVDLPTKIKFRKISLIEQVDGGQWIILKEFRLRDGT